MVWLFSPGKPPTGSLIFRCDRRSITLLYAIVADDRCQVRQPGRDAPLSNANLRASPVAHQTPPSGDDPPRTIEPGSSNIPSLPLRARCARSWWPSSRNLVAISDNCQRGTFMQFIDRMLEPVPKERVFACFSVELNAQRRGISRTGRQAPSSTLPCRNPPWEYTPPPWFER